MPNNSMSALTLGVSLLMLVACGNDNAVSEINDAVQVKAQHTDHDDGDQHTENEHGAEESDIVLLDASAAREAGIVVEQASLTNVERNLSLPAEIRFDADRIANVSPQVSGVIRRLYASEGDNVELGDRLALVSSRELASMKADYLSALSAESLARAELSREEQLWSERITSEADLLSARAAVTAAAATRESTENKLHAVGLDHGVIDSLDGAADGALSQFVVTAPLAGTIIRRPVTLGETVVSGESGGVPLFTIADDSVIWADIAVFKKDLSQVKKGSSVTLKEDTGEALGAGTISFISPIVDETSRTATARVVVDNADGNLRPGQFVTAEITIGNRTSQLRIRTASVQSVEGRQSVFVPVEGGFTPRQVVTGLEAGGFIEIKSGLNVGDLYVAAGAFTLKAQLEKDAFGDDHDH